jgi:phenylpropionate dioxygenase-like ring-hydroxylating dioxygenase large terminal subunit
VSEHWQPVIETGQVPEGRVVAVDVADAEAVIWRTEDGFPCVMARHCPHLDWDLTEAVVAGEELVCSGHGWSLGCDGEAFKRNEWGREDPKGTIRIWPVRERDGWIEADTAMEGPSSSV